MRLHAHTCVHLCVCACMFICLQKVKDEPRFGGIMFWDASFDQNNMIGGKHFSDHIADFIKRGGTVPTGKPVTLPPGKSTLKPKTERPTKPTPPCKNHFLKL